MPAELLQHLVIIANIRHGNIDRRVVSLTEQMDTTTPQGEFLFHVFDGSPPAML
jgi:hypothetical protein